MVRNNTVIFAELPMLQIQFTHQPRLLPRRGRHGLPCNKFMNGRPYNAGCPISCVAGINVHIWRLECRGNAARFYLQVANHNIKAFVYIERAGPESLIQAIKGTGLGLAGTEYSDLNATLQQRAQNASSKRASPSLVQ